jgi:FkbM family methyltransferase
MHPIEKAAIRLRHSKTLRNASGLWSLVRPAYNAVVNMLGSRGLTRNINGTDPLLVAPALRDVTEVYEPEVWGKVMEFVRKGDVICDVGAHFGLYTVAFAHRIGPDGRVHAFEPEPANQAVLRSQVRLNRAQDNVVIHPAAVGRQDGPIQFASQAEQSGIATGSGSYKVKCVTLDSVFKTDRVDILKIDVEGFEEWVLEGGTKLLADASRRPRVVFIEVHPYAWGMPGTSTDSLKSRLESAGYAVRTMDDRPISTIERYGHIYAKHPA